MDRINKEEVLELALPSHNISTGEATDSWDIFSECFKINNQLIVNPRSRYRELYLQTHPKHNNTKAALI